MEMTVSNRMEGRRHKMEKEGRKGVASENVQNKKDYRKDISHEMGSERRGKVGKRLQPNLVPSFLPLLPVSSPHHLFHGAFISRNPCGAEQFILTFFSLQLVLLFSPVNILLQFLKLTILLTTQANLYGKICFRGLVSVSPAKTEYHLCVDLTVTVQRYRAEVHPTLV